MNTKRTPELLKEVKRLYFEEHWTPEQIGDKVGLCSTTITFWVKDKKGISHKCDGIGDYPERIPLFIRQNLEKETNPLDIIKERIEKGLCRVCGKEKEEKWKLTHYCGLKCFSAEIVL